ncbi:cyclophilin-like fold protein [Nocardia sp. NBC_00881]|uniref:cyclophilin-like fold protein n=1 Tax=Nocardia sp. NBC_00881 TaxID=2975995 RepID=UPI00386B6070|nr:cyclophilin-like fold protein [Nocardia sp. NBC_00881]
MRLRATTLFALSAIAAAAIITACSNAPKSPGPTPPAGATQPATTPPGQEATFMQIRLRIGAAEATARLYDIPTARDFASLLPLTLTVHDLGSREKAGTLPRALGDGRGRSGYRAGQLGYWAPSHDLAIYYHEDGFRIPNPGIVMIGEIDTGLDAVTAADSSALTITAA